MCTIFNQILKSRRTVKHRFRTKNKKVTLKNKYNKITQKF